MARFTCCWKTVGAFPRHVTSCVVSTAHLQICIDLNQSLDNFPDTIKETPAEVELTNELFEYWGARPGWDADTNGPWPAHLPIHDSRFSVGGLKMTDSATGNQVADTVLYILLDMVGEAVQVEPLAHYRTVFLTPAVKCTWFSCCQEFLHCILGSLLGKHPILSVNLHLLIIIRSS